MNEFLIFNLSLLVMVAVFEASAGRRRLVMGIAAVGAFLTGVFIDPSALREEAAIAALAGIPVGYLVYMVVSFIPLQRK